MKLAAVVVIALIVAVGAAVNAPAQSQTIRERLLGVYTLGEYGPHGDEPTGRISYDASGRMWAMLLPPNREPVEGSSTAEQVRETMRGVVAYYGSYTIDEPSGRVIHHVEAASNPAWIGDDFIRWYRFDGQNLLISLNSEFNNPLVWVRMPDSAAD